MNIEFTGRNFSVSDRIKDFTENKLAKIVKFLSEPVDLHVILEAEKHHYKAEIHVHHRHGVLQASESSDHMRDAIQSAVEKIEKQARRARKKFTDKKRRSRRDDNHWPLDVLDPASVGTGSTPRIIKSTALPIKPMSIEEAALELSQSKNEFFVFLDSGTERVSVLYRRKDENYGLISPEF